MGGLLILSGLLKAVGLPAQNCDPAPAGLISWWSGDTNANDIAGTNNGTLHGGATAGNPGIVGGCFVFDGTNNYCAIPDAPSLHPTNLTIESWVRCDLLNAASNGGYPGLQYIIFHQNAEMYNFEGFALVKDRRPVGVATNDTWCFSVTSTNGTNIFVESLTHVQTNVWYHVAGVRGSNYIQIYVNGVLEAQTNVGFPQGYGPYPLYFADTGESYYDPKFAGALDEVALYNRALSSNEIHAIYAARRARKVQNPDRSLHCGGARRVAAATDNWGFARPGLWRSDDDFGAWGKQHLDGPDQPDAFDFRRCLARSRVRD